MKYDRFITALSTIVLLSFSSEAATPVIMPTFVQELHQKSFSSIIPGNYSGITRISGNRYAVVDDKSPSDGFHFFDIDIDSISGDILSATMSELITNGHPNRDGEGIVYVPSSNTLFISGEADKRILEYKMDGSMTGRELQIPSIFNSALPNSNFEALAYNPETHLFWTTTESTLPFDGEPSSPNNGIRNMLRIQCFDEDMQPVRQYAYLMDAPVSTKKSSPYAMGVSEITALDDGQLVILEREFIIPPSKFGARVNCKLYVVNPDEGEPLSNDKPLSDSSSFLKKTKLYEFKTSLTLASNQIANYEGMCLGPTLPDGNQTLILISDSQNHYGGVLKDWLKVIIISENKKKNNT